jgi:release factor glutamine methyltransferase
VIAATLGAASIEARNQLMRELALDRDVAALEVHALLAHVLCKPRSYLLAYQELVLTDSVLVQFSTLLGRRLQGEPIAYLLGQREFYGLPLRVSPDVLIPRPETELLVELALERLPQNRPARVLDLGTGSGAIAIALAKSRPEAQITAVDISPRALELAQANATQLNASQIAFVASDWFSALPALNRFDLIVSNPPYIAAGDPHLLSKDIEFEPALALVAGPNGMEAIRRIAPVALNYLVAGGYLLIEHGYDQKESCAALFSAVGYAQVKSHYDLGGNPRVTLGKKGEYGEEAYNNDD